MHAPYVPENQTDQRPRRLARNAAIGLALLAGGLIGWRIYAHNQLRQTTAEQAVLPVVITHPTATGSSDLVLPGTVQANIEAPIYARTGGYLKRWLVDIGAHVKAGQLLAEIDAPEVAQQLAQAEADLKTAQANAQLAQVTAQRWKDLLATDAVSRQAADEKISDAAAKQAAVAGAQANVQRLRETLGFARIVAPFDGTITARGTDVGALIAAGGGTGPELFRIADTSHLRIYIQAPQVYAPLIRPGMEASLRFTEHPGQDYKARLVSTAGAIDPASRTLQVQLSADNAKGELLPGGYAEVHLPLPRQANTLRLPSNTIIFDSNGTAVALVDQNQKIKRQPVTLGRDFGAEVEVVNGVAANDTVIVNPPDTLLDGEQVRIVQTAKPQPNP